MNALVQQDERWLTRVLNIVLKIWVPCGGSPTLHGSRWEPSEVWILFLIYSEQNKLHMYLQRLLTLLFGVLQFKFSRRDSLN